MNNISENGTNIFLEQVLDSVKIGVVAFDSDHYISMVNAGLLNMFGYSQEEVLKHPVNILFDTNNYKTIHKLIDNAEYSKNVLSTPKYEINASKYDNTIIPMEISITKNDGNQNHMYILIMRDISEFKQTVDDLKYLAYYDQLTKIPNRTLFMDRSATAIRQSRRDNEHLAIVYIDLDEFKIINDRLGHEYGDIFLKELSLRFQKCIRESDTVSRVGGDEFTILMPKISHINDASSLAERILESNKKPVKLNTDDIYPKTSVGISIFPEDGDNIEILLKCADIAMYRAKERGKNQYVFYNSNHKVK